MNECGNYLTYFAPAHVSDITTGEWVLCCPRSRQYLRRPYNHDILPFVLNRWKPVVLPFVSLRRSKFLNVAGWLLSFWCGKLFVIVVFGVFFSLQSLSQELLFHLPPHQLLPPRWLHDMLMAADGYHFGTKLLRTTNHFRTILMNL